MKNLTNAPGNKISNRTMHGVKLAAVVAACVAFSACGAIAEKATEKGAERIIESQTGENVDLDFDSGDGSFSVKTEDGSFAVDEDGNFVVTDQDGSVFTGSASDDGLVVLDDNGDPVLNVSGDANGGELTVQGGDGEAIYRNITDIPAEWPSDVPRPEGMNVEGGAFVQADGETALTLLGTPSNDAIDYTNAYGNALTAAGLTETGRYDQSSDGGTTAQRTFENANWTLNINGYVDGDSTNMVNISLVSKTN